MGPIVPLLAILALFVCTVAARAQEPPTFLIESITVEGTSAAAIVIAESRLTAGESYGEPELRDAVARIQRLPFAVSTDFRLAKGSAPGRYILIVSIRQMKPFFLNAATTTIWSADRRRTPQGPQAGEPYIDQRRTVEVTAGARAFLGAKGVLNLAANRVEDRNDRFTVAFSQYDIFGTRASLTAVVSYLEDPGAIRSADPGARADWHFRDNLTWELIGVVPISRNDSLRGSWQRSERPVRYVEPRPGGGFRPILRSLPEIRKELFWIHDTTNDPLFPTSGTRLSAGIIRTSTPTAGRTELGRLKLDEYRATLEHSWSLTSRQALTLGGSALDYDRVIDQYRAYSRYSIDLWGRERTLRSGDLRLELHADRIFTAVRRPPYSARSTAGAAITWRNVWGVVRLDASYQGWREP
ncbi:MAG TPA: hypothetical protein VF618_00035 [Thermoanaerobaculia bacterium]